MRCCPFAMYSACCCLLSVCCVQAAGGGGNCRQCCLVDSPGLIRKPFTGKLPLTCSRTVHKQLGQTRWHSSAVGRRARPRCVGMISIKQAVTRALVFIALLAPEVSLRAVTQIYTLVTRYCHKVWLTDGICLKTRWPIHWKDDKESIVNKHFNFWCVYYFSL